MKYKLIMILSCLLCFVAVVTASLVKDDNAVRYHQHVSAEPVTEKCTHDKNTFCTHLPLVIIDTDNFDIPGKSIADEEGNVTGYTTVNGQSEIISSINIIDNSGKNNHIFDEADIKTRAYINVRGNSSRSFDKSGYALRFVTESDENNTQKVMGMDAHHEWILHGPFLDKSLIRNYMWYNIAGEIMDYSPNVRFCEVILNGEYNGLYVMCESITAGKNGARLNLSVDKKDNTFSGYLLRLDRGSATELKNIDTFSSYSLRNKMTLNIEYPGISNLTEKIARNINLDFSKFEKSLYSYDFDNEKYGYKKYIDSDSFADYFLINEFTCNYDAGWLSTFVYKDIDGKYRMCIWDFNSACDGYQESMIFPNHFEMQNCLWYIMLIKDEDFTDRIISRYKELRKTYFSDGYLENYIDSTVEYLGDAIERNYEKWGYSFEEEYDMLEPAERNPRCHKEATEQIKTFIHKRGVWMDENIEALRQYSKSSKIKKFDEDAN